MVQPPGCLVAQSCLSLGDPMDYSPPGSSVHGIFQAKQWNVLPFHSTTRVGPGKTYDGGGGGGVIIEYSSS